jgi:hypothetical protein
MANSVRAYPILFSMSQALTNTLSGKGSHTQLSQAKWAATKVSVR